MAVLPKLTTMQSTKIPVDFFFFRNRQMILILTWKLKGSSIVNTKKNKIVNIVPDFISAGVS